MVEGQREIWLGVVSFTQNGFARILSQQRYRKPIVDGRGYSLVLPNKSIRTDHEFWPDDVSITDRVILMPGRG